METKLTRKGIRINDRDIAKLFAKFLPLPDSEVQSEDWTEYLLLGHKNKPLLKRLTQETFSTKVNEYVAVIRKLSPQAKVALRSAYVFSSKVPKQERDDFFQELSLAVLEARTKDERLAYTICRMDWQNWWRKYKLHSQFFGGYLSEFERIEVEADGLLDLPKVEFGKAIAEWSAITRQALIEVYDERQQAIAEQERLTRARILGDTFCSAVEFENQAIGDMDGQRLWNGLPGEIKRIVGNRMAGKALPPKDRQRLSRFARSHTSLLMPQS